MKNPRILKLIDTVVGPTWTMALDHGCNSELEMKLYCEEADPTGLTIKLVDLGEPDETQSVHEKRQHNSCSWSEGMESPC